MSIPTIGPAVAARTLPGGVPFLRRQLLDELVVFQCGLDPDATPGAPGLFGPGSPSWQVMGNVARPIGGVRAGLLQGMLAPIPAAVDSTSQLADDFLGRIGRTATFVQRRSSPGRRWWRAWSTEASRRPDPYPTGSNRSSVPW